MKIRNITFESGNDFHAIMVCEHCYGCQEMKHGYHDNFFHTRVIPAMFCPTCKRNRDGTFEASGNAQAELPANPNAGVQQASPRGRWTDTPDS